MKKSERKGARRKGTEEPVVGVDPSVTAPDAGAEMGAVEAGEPGDDREDAVAGDPRGEIAAVEAAADVDAGAAAPEAADAEASEADADDEALLAAATDDAGAEAAPADEEVPAADPSVSEVEAARLEAEDDAGRERQLVAVVEALLFASEEPVTVPALRKVVEDATAEELRGALARLKEEYDAGGRGVTLVEIAGGYLLGTRDAFAPWVEKMVKGKRRVRLSRAGLETIAVIAYKQPISRGEIERIRGVDCGGVLGTLVERDLVTIKGRDPGPGKPLLYGTTQEFLNYFGLNKISELPRLDELTTLAARNPTWSDAERARFQKHGVDEVQLELGATPDGAEAEPAAAEGEMPAAGELTEAAASEAVLSEGAAEGEPLEAAGESPEAAQGDEPPAARRPAAVAYEAADGDADTDAGYGHDVRPH